MHKCVGNIHKFPLFYSYVHISSCIRELASQNDESSFQVICVCFSKCGLSTFHKHHTAVRLSFLLSLFNSALVNTQ